MNSPSGFKPLDAIGATLPGLPAVVLGRTAGVAWGFTNTSPDVQDLYLEQINPANPKQYRTPEGWADFAVREDPEISFNAGSGIETHQIRATCSEREPLCRLNSGGPRLPDGFLINVEGASSVVDGRAAGTVIWRVYMPGVSEVTVRVFTGQPGRYDIAPDGSQPTRMKKGGRGNTWIIPS